MSDFIEHKGAEIFKNIADNENPNVVLDKIADLVQHYARVVNDAFYVVPEDDVVYAVAAIEMFSQSLLDSCDASEEMRMTVESLKKLFNPRNHVIRKESSTKTAAKIIYEQAKNGNLTDFE